MDPFLEVNPRWQVFHGWFVRKLAEQNLPRARELGCWIDVERSVYQREPSGELVLVGEYLVVRELGQFQRVLAVVEVLSFANKEGSYVLKYREKRSKFLTSLADDDRPVCAPKARPVLPGRITRVAFGRPGRGDQSI
jgi:hypothetical protein